MFSTVLIANRGEIACRIIRTLRALGIRSVAVHTEADAGARHVQLADIAVPIGSYLDIEQVTAAARDQGADAIHPGYGFLSENPAFAEACAAAGIVFVGPSVHALTVMGDKISAKAQVEKRGVRTVPGLARPGLSDEELREGMLALGLPVLIKPSAGGGGKGMHLVEQVDQIDAALASARREAASSFGDDTLFIERFVRNPRHIEVQVLADAEGTTIHLGERECSLQRRHQKVIEEAPSALLSPETRALIGEAACETARSVGYLGAGTVEFIVSADAPDEFFFMEMNTRLQVEHPVTELVTGVDLVEWQLRIAAGEPFGVAQSDVVLSGHAVEARVYAEDPARGFLPTGGTVLSLAEPEGTGIRVDSSLVEGLTVSSQYDPMLAKVIAWGPDRAAALNRLRSALGDVVTAGVTTNVDFLRRLLADPDVVAGDLDTELIGRRLEEWEFPPPGADMIAAAALLEHARHSGTSLWNGGDGWRIGDNQPTRYRMLLQPSGVTTTVTVDGGTVTVDGVETEPARHVHSHRDGETLYLTSDGVSASFTAARAARSTEAAELSPELRAPMPGAVVAIPATDGATVEEGDPIVIVEAMKMEHVLRAPSAGVAEIRVSVGAQVGAGEVVATIVSQP